MLNLRYDIIIIIEEAFGNAFIDHFSCKPNFHENLTFLKKDYNL